jgi:hypothetical protein
MENRSLMETKTVTIRAGTKLRLEYYLTCDPAGSYGVEVCAYSPGVEERICIPDLTPARERVALLLSRMAAGLVTPTGVYDIVQDWL